MHCSRRNVRFQKVIENCQVGNSMRSSEGRRINDHCNLSFPSLSDVDGYLHDIIENVNWPQPKILKSRAFERIEYVGYPCDWPGVESMKEAGSICVLIVGQSCSSLKHSNSRGTLMRDMSHVPSSQFRAALTANLSSFTRLLSAEALKVR